MNRELTDVTHLIIDEVHERDIETELLLLLIKHLLKSNKVRGSTDQARSRFYVRLESVSATFQSVYP